jgi:hypothetical protein
VIDNQELVMTSKESSTNKTSRKYKYYIKKFSDKYQKPLGGLGPNYNYDWE